MRPAGRTRKMPGNSHRRASSRRRRTTGSDRCGSRSNPRPGPWARCAYRTRCSSCGLLRSARARCRGSSHRGRRRTPAVRFREVLVSASSSASPRRRACRAGRSACRASEPAPWQVVHSVIVPAWPCSSFAATLSLCGSTGLGQIACVLLWQPSHATPPWPLLKRNSVFAFSANRLLRGQTRRGGCVRRVERDERTEAVGRHQRRVAASGSSMASPVWQDWQRGRSIQGRRALPSFVPSMLPPAASGDMPPTARHPAVAVLAGDGSVMAPRRHCVVLPGWQR